MRRAITSSALEHGGKFPNFKIPNYEVKAFGMRNEALFETVAFAPIVKHEELEQYLVFANDTRGWVEESKKIYDELEPGKNRSSEPITPPFPKTLMCVDHREYQKDYSKVLVGPCAIQKEEYLPLLQISPPPYINETFNNIDFFSDFLYQEIVMAASQVKDLVFSVIDVDPHVFDFVFGLEVHPSLVHTHPHTLTAIPVFDDIIPTDTIVGYVFGVLAWDKYMTGTFPICLH